MSEAPVTVEVSYLTQKLHVELPSLDVSLEFLQEVLSKRTLIPPHNQKIILKGV